MVYGKSPDYRLCSGIQVADMTIYEPTITKSYLKKYRNYDVSTSWTVAFCKLGRFTTASV